MQEVRSCSRPKKPLQSLVPVYVNTVVRKERTLLHTHTHSQSPSIYSGKHGVLPTPRRNCVCMCMSLVSRVPTSCLLYSSLLLPSEPPWGLLSLPFWSLPSLFTSSFPHSPQISLQGEADVSSSSSSSSLLIHSSLPSGSSGSL